jgi:hypothetical protein
MNIILMGGDEGWRMEGWLAKKRDEWLRRGMSG